MFGEGFKHMDSNESLADGQYTAKIVKAENKSGSYGDYIQCTVTVNDRQVYPNLFLINDSPKSGFGQMSYEQAMEMWNRNMTKFFANFNIPEGCFDCSKWIGHTGTVTVRAQKKKPEYKEIVPYTVSARKTQSTEEKTEKAEVKTTTQNTNGFSEDIPF